MYCMYMENQQNSSVVVVRKIKVNTLNDGQDWESLRQPVTNDRSVCGESHDHSPENKTTSLIDWAKGIAGHWEAV